MNRHDLPQHGRDTGAVAIVVAISAMLIFGMAALAVELTDMYSRDRAVQTTADLAALAGAQDLPNSCTAFTSALSYLNSSDNGVRDDTRNWQFQATSAEMDDNDVTNGEIDVLNSQRNPLSVTVCSDHGRYVRVTTPPRTKQFVFGSAVGGPSSGDVRAVAMARLGGLNVSVLPLALPANCPPGPNLLFVDNGINLDYDPKGSNNAPVIEDLVPGIIAPSSTSTVTIAVTALPRDPKKDPVQFDFTLFRVDGSRQLYEVTAPVLATGSPAYSANNWSGTFSVSLPTPVRTTEGTWRVRANQPTPDKWTDDPEVGTLVVADSSSAACPEPSTGDFGLIASPRNQEADGLNSVDNQRTKNFVFGIDHDLDWVSAPQTNVPCIDDGNPYTDGILDDDANPTRDGANCINVKPGGTLDMVTSGLIDGIHTSGDIDGRLVARDGSPAPPFRDNCRMGGDSDFRWSKNGETLVNTVLSCYLAPDKKLADVMAGTPDSLVPEIVNDPRFFFIPVIKTTNRPKNSSKGAAYWPIVQFRAAFITNESAGGDATCAADDGDFCNGLNFNTASNGTAKIKSIQAFVFKLSALPQDVETPGNAGAYLGGHKELELVE